MKKYFIYTNQIQQGPFEIEQLKSLNLHENTPIWYEGIVNWTTVENVEELKFLIKTNVTPPKYEIPIKDGISLEPPKLILQQEKITVPKKNAQNTESQIIENNKNNSKRNLIIGIGILIGLLIMGIGFNNSNSNRYSGESNAISINPEATAVEVSDAEAAVRSAEYESQNANSSLTEKNMNYRNSYEKYLKLSRNSFQSREIGGIYDLAITFTNDTEYVIDVVNVQVGYIQENGNYYKTETLQFTNVQPFAEETLSAPDSERGLSVDYQFSEIYSKKMHFYYPSNSGNNSDPYFYK